MLVFHLYDMFIAYIYIILNYIQTYGMSTSSPRLRSTKPTNGTAWKAGDRLSDEEPEEDASVKGL